MHFLSSIQLLKLSISLSLLILGYFLALKCSHLIERSITKRFSRHIGLLFRRSVFYIIFILFMLMSLQNFGLNLNVFLGAAGIFTLAISFASQTAISNLISGLFLLFEQPFKIGDHIIVNDINGRIESIDLLSTKLSTVDRKLVRLPNEMLIKTAIFNLSYYPTSSHQSDS